MILSWCSPSIPILRSKETAVTPEDESWLGSLIFLGAVITSPIFSYINQNMGRKAAGYISAVPLIIGWILIIFADSILIICIARFIQGLSISGVNIFITMYVGEISDDGIRGALGNIRGIGTDFGIMLMYIIAPYFSILVTSIISIALPVFFLFAFFWLPESPMFLLWKGKSEEAKKAYLWLRGGDQKAAEEEMSKLKAVVSQSENQNTSFKELFSVRGTRKALLIVFILAIAQQFSGMNVVFGYCESILEMSGSTLAPDLAAIIFGVINLSGSFFSCFCADLAGRRLILIVTQVMQGVCLGALGAYLYARELGVDVSFMGVLPVISLSFYSFCLVAGPANMFFVVLSEIFRPEARGIANNISSTVLWILSFLSTKFFSEMVDTMGPHGCFFLFTAVSFAGAIFVYFQLPETKNRPLESILRELNGETEEK